MEEQAVNQSEVRLWQQSLAIPAILKRNAGWVALLACAGALLGALAGTQVPSTYEAVTTVKIGQLTQVGSPFPKLIESSLEAAQRVKTPGFLREVRVGEPAAAGDAIADKVLVRPLRDAGVMELRFRSGTRQGAEQGAAAVFQLLRARHEEMLKPGRAKLQEELRQVESLKAAAESRRAQLLQRLAGLEQPRLRDNLVLQLNFADDYVDLRRWELGLRAVLEEPWNTSTKLLEPVTVRQRSRAFQVLALAMAGFVAGLVLAVVLARRREARRGHPGAAA